MKLTPAPLKRQVERFLQAKQKPEREPRPQKNLARLIAECEPINLGDLYNAFSGHWQKEPSLKGEVEAVITPLLTAAGKLNRQNQTKRFFALEGLRVFGSAQSNHRLSQTLLGYRHPQKAAYVIQLVRSFQSTDRVVTELLKQKHLFSKPEQEKKLRSFRLESAKSLLTLFDQGFLKSRVQRPGQGSGSSSAKKRLSALAQMRKLYPLSHQELSQGVVQGRKLTHSLAKLLGDWQSNGCLPLFSKKRYDYLKSVFLGKLAPGGLPGLSLEQSGLLLASFLEMNRQLKPPTLLLAQMCNLESAPYDRCAVDLKGFLDQLPPKGLEETLRNLKEFLALMKERQDTPIEELFSLALAKQQAGLPATSLAERVIGGLLELRQKGLLLYQSVLDFLEEIRQSLLAAKNQERMLLDLDELEGLFPQEEKPPLFTRQPDFLEQAMSYRQVLTSIGGHRGMKEGGNMKNLQEARLLFPDPNLQDLFVDAFERLREHLQPNAKTIKDRYQEGGKDETIYSMSFLRHIPGEEPHLFCLGYSHFTVKLEGLDPQVMMLPYAIPLTPTGEGNAISTHSRRITDPDLKPQKPNEDLFGNQIMDTHFAKLEFKPMDLGQTETLMQTLTSLLEIFHLLPEPEWNKPEIQEAVGYLHNRLGMRRTQAYA